MNILINIHTDSELIAYEAISLAFTMASFDHQVQLFLGGRSDMLLQDPKSRLYGMIQSLDLYDIPKAWHGFDGINHLPLDIIDHIEVAPQDDPSQFDSVLSF